MFEKIFNEEAFPGQCSSFNSTSKTFRPEVTPHPFPFPRLSEQRTAPARRRKTCIYRLVLVCNLACYAAAGGTRDRAVAGSSAAAQGPAALLSAAPRARLGCHAPLSATPRSGQVMRGTRRAPGGFPAPQPWGPRPPKCVPCTHRHYLFLIKWISD